MIEIDETKPVEASLTIVLRGDDIGEFKEMIQSACYEESSYRFARKIREAINS